MQLMKLIHQLNDAFLEYGDMQVVLADNDGNIVSPVDDMSIEYVESDNNPISRKTLVIWPVDTADEFTFSTTWEEE